MLGDADDEAEVGFDEVVLRPAAVVGEPGEFPGKLVVVDPVRELLCGEQADLDPPGEVDLILGAQEGPLPMRRR
ncbi:hypothetical protein RGU41_17900 [Cryobacterium sp. 10C3]|nr:hypothetical protein [Cryobacterium sp. 10C3]MDY7558456.1 hypothetical protein [Cryobacterium sp. 10C3]